MIDYKDYNPEMNKGTGEFLSPKLKFNCVFE